MLESFHSSLSFVLVIEKGFESEVDLQSFILNNRTQGGLLGNNSIKPISNEKDRIINGNGSLAKINVVVRLLLKLDF
jgi:hypothetical protein